MQAQERPPAFARRACFQAWAAGTVVSAELPTPFSCEELLHGLFVSKSSQVISILSQRSGSLLRSPHSLPECWTLFMHF